MQTNLKSSMHWFFITLEKIHFGPILGLLCPKNFKTKFFYKKSFTSNLNLYTTVTYTKKVLGINFSLNLKKTHFGSFWSQNPRARFFLKRLFKLDVTLNSWKKSANFCKRFQRKTSNKQANKQIHKQMENIPCAKNVKEIELEAKTWRNFKTYA